MSERHLRDLLRQAVPDPPELDPRAVALRAGRARRTKGWAVAAGAAAALIVAAGPVLLTQLTGSESAPAAPVTTPPPVASEEPDRPLSPYDVPTCPSVPVDPKTASTAVTDLDDVVAVRLCPDLLGPRRLPGAQLSAEQLQVLEDADALVDDLVEFAAILRRIPVGLPDYCSDLRGPFRSESYAFDRADGTRVLVSAPGCSLVTIEGRRVHSEAVRQQYVAALDRQRERLSYTRPFDADLTCQSSGRGGPVRPGRERLVAAVVCDPPPGAENTNDLRGARLDAAQLAELDEAWGRPGTLVSRGSSATQPCLDQTVATSFVMAATDRSDVVQLVDSPCGYLVWQGQEPGEGATIPTTLRALGLE